MSLSKFLANEDVLTQIFDYFSLFPLSANTWDRDFSCLAIRTQQSARQVLVNAALACRAFSGPALKVLWSVLPYGLWQLVRLLPGVRRRNRRRVKRENVRTYRAFDYVSTVALQYQHIS